MCDEVRAPGRQLGTVLFVTHDHDVIGDVATRI
jgi:ATPase subunit of ABC transporter with duplicated ATPase domains